MAQDEAIFLNNLVPSQYGPRVRTGYQDWATDVGTDGVRTVIPFTGESSSFDRLFAVASDGIYDVSSPVATPSVLLALASVDSTSGLGNWANFVNDNGDYFCLYCDETNGYYVYTSSTDTWAKIAMGGGATQISGVDPANFAYVRIFKNRVWFVEKGTGNAWYLAAGAIYGAATKFNFGNKFTHGGSLVALYNWTVDGGEGVDDYLVAIGAGGDVVVYKGTDPATATDWFLHGAWFIGPPPSGRRIAGSFSGELYLLSSYGILPMSRLMSGTLVQLDDVYLSKKISPLINEQMIASRTTLGWEIKLIPTENILLVSTPKREAFDYTQFAYSLNTPGWCVYRDIPYYTGDTWNGGFYIGTEDGRVVQHTGNLDNVSMDESTFDQITWSALQTFQEQGAPGHYKRTHFIRPVFLASEAPSFAVEARYDYNLSEVLPAPQSSVGLGYLWDAAISLWDLATWGGEFVVVQDIVGASGMGRTIAVGLNGSSAVETILVRYDIMVDQGGMI
jgi:hypothetical protein